MDNLFLLQLQQRQVVFTKASSSLSKLFVGVYEENPTTYISANTNSQFHNPTNTTATTTTTTTTTTSPSNLINSTDSDTYIHPATIPESLPAQGNATTDTSTTASTTRTRLNVSLLRRESLAAARGSMSERGSIGFGRCSFAVESEALAADEQGNLRLRGSSVVGLLQGDEKG